MNDREILRKKVLCKASSSRVLSKTFHYYYYYCFDDEYDARDDGGVGDGYK